MELGLGMEGGKWVQPRIAFEVCEGGGESKEGMTQ